MAGDSLINPMRGVRWPWFVALGALFVLAIVALVSRAGDDAQSAYDEPFHWLEPTRLVDTRAGGETIDGDFVGIGPLVGNATLDVDVGGRGGVPDGDDAVVALHIIATNTTEASHLTAYPTGSGRPLASNLNFDAGDTVANLVVVGLGDEGRVTLFNAAGGAHLVVDVLGWWQAESIGEIVPARLVDTRQGQRTIDGQDEADGAFGPGETRPVQVAGRGGVPEDGVVAVVLNVTAAAPSASGYLAVHPAGADQEGTSNVNFDAGQVNPNLVIVPLGDDGQISISNPTGTTDVVVDVLAYFTDRSAFGELTPARLADSRPDGSTVDGRFVGVAAGDDTRVLNVEVTGRGEVPDDAGSVALNVTVAARDQPIELTVFGAGDAPPAAANLEIAPGQTFGNLVVVPVGLDGQVSIAGLAEDTDVVVDVLAWFPPSGGDAPGNDLLLRADGLGDDDFGGGDGVIGDATEVYGEPELDRTQVFATVLETEVAPTITQADGDGDGDGDRDGAKETWLHPASGQRFAHRVGREVCFDDGRLCLYFGGDSDPDEFVGWAYGAAAASDPTYDGRLVDADGLSLYSRASDHPIAIGYDGGGCVLTGPGTSASGLDLILLSLGEGFLIGDGEGDEPGLVPNRPPPGDVYVAGMAAGDRFAAADDC